MKILVTGAHGFLGRNTAAFFSRRGHTVSGIGHGTWSPAELAEYGLFHWYSGDITLDALIKFGAEPDLIVHCAGSGSVAFSVANPYADYLRTVGSTAAVLEYIRLHSPGTKLIYPSSAAVYGEAVRLPIREDDALRPVSPYGTHKLMAEQLCRSFASTHGLYIGIIRFFSIYGEGLMKQLLWDACTKAHSGDFFFAGTGREIRDWIHVRDAASLIERVSQVAAPHCPTINGGSGIPLAVNELIAAIFKSFPDLPRAEFNGVARPGDPLGYQADIGAATLLGWSREIDWQDGIRRYVNWFSSRLR